MSRFIFTFVYSTSTSRATNCPVNVHFRFCSLSLPRRPCGRSPRRPGGQTGGPLCRNLPGMQTRAGGDPVSAGGRRRPRAHCVVDLICALLSRRVDKDRSGVISDSELQQALSNGVYAHLTSSSSFTSSHFHRFLPALPPCSSFFLFSTLRLPSISSVHAAALRPVF